MASRLHVSTPWIMASSFLAEPSVAITWRLMWQKKKEVDVADHGVEVRKQNLPPASPSSHSVVSPAAAAASDRARARACGRRSRLPCRVLPAPPPPRGRRSPRPPRRCKVPPRRCSSPPLRLPELHKQSAAARGAAQEAATVAILATAAPCSALRSGNFFFFL
jgi:hypothetical protein